MNLIYSCVFHNEDYLKLASLLFKSFSLYSNIQSYDYLVITEKRFESSIEKLYSENNINGLIWCLTANSQLEACYTRLKIFDYPNINKYDKILYLDTDILIIGGLNEIFDLQLIDKLYCFNEGKKVLDWGHGKILFRKYRVKIDYNLEMFSTCVMLFLNTDIMKQLFKEILEHINSMFPNPLLYNLKSSFEQDFIIYHTYINGLYDNELITKYVINSNSDLIITENNIRIIHFCVPCGNTTGKYERMDKYFSNMI